MTILTQLANLSVEELDEVIKEAKALRQFAATGARVAAGSGRRGTDPYDWILAVLAQACADCGLAAFDVEPLKRSRLYTKGFRERIPAVHTHIEGFTTKRMWQRTVYYWAYRHMAGHYRWGPKRMLASTSEIPRMLDEMLPGYYQAGLMEKALRTVHGDHKGNDQRRASRQ